MKTSKDSISIGEIKDFVKEGSFTESYVLGVANGNKVVVEQGKINCAQIIVKERVMTLAVNLKTASDVPMFEDQIVPSLDILHEKLKEKYLRSEINPNGYFTDVLYQTV